MLFEVNNPAALEKKAAVFEEDPFDLSGL